MANLSNINNNFIVTDVGTGQAIVGATNAVTGSTLTVGGTAADTILAIANTVNWKIHSASSSSPYAVSSGDFLIRNASSNVLNLQNNGNAIFAGSITVNGISSTLKTGGSGTLVTNDSLGYPRITITSASAQLGLFRASDGGMYIGGSSAGFRVYNSSFAQKLIIDSGGGGATFSSTVKATTYLVNRTSAAGIGTSLGDINGAELGPGYLTVSRDDTANAKQLSFYKNNVEHSYFETTTSGLSIGGTNVGIGTDSPGEKLEVNGVIQIKRAGDHPAMRFIEDTTTRGYIGTGDWAINGLADEDLGISSASTGSLVLGTNSGNARVYIINGGNVGIGINPPTQPLDVNGIMKHKGLDMTSGSQVDQTTTFNVSLVASANTWTDIPGIIGSDIPSSGHYMVGLYSNARGSSGWYYVYWTTYMGWNLTSGTNSSEFSEMPLTYGAHSTNGNSLELRTSMQNGTGGTSNQMRIQFKVSFATTGTALRLIFRKLIS